MSRSHRPSVVQPRVRCGLVLAGAVLLGGATVAALAVPSAVAGATSTTTPSVVLTVPTAGHHTYRHGAVPRKTRDVAGVRALGSTPAVPGAAAQAARASTRKALRYGGGLTAGGLTGAGVTVGQPEVYLVFMGNQWGTQSTSGGRQFFTNDPAAMAPALQTLFGGLGTGGETWSGILTQYCDGAPIGATACLQGDTQVPYPTGGVLSGIWYDNSSSATTLEAAGLTGHQLAAEAEAAATHFGNTDQTSNRNTQYVIVSPTGSDPDGWTSPVNGYCAYHDDTHDPSIDGGGPVAGPIVAFTNLPYVPDAKASCGAGSVNSPGTLDGATEAASHEYAETMTDQFPESSPPGGWTDSSGQENGDKCAYVSTGPGAMFNLTLATGAVTVQGTWSNRANNCADGEANFGYTPSVTSFSPATAAAGSSVTITGVNLGGATAVSFAGTPGTITAGTTTSVTATVPVGAADGTQAVTTAAGSATSAKPFHSAPSITSYTPDPVPRGGTLTITGSGLGGAKKVTIGGKKATISSESATQVLVTVPIKAVTGLIVVTSKYGTATSATVLTVN
jgi:predicted RecA/RadA family phage recombinase